MQGGAYISQLVLNVRVEESMNQQRASSSRSILFPHFLVKWVILDRVIHGSWVCVWGGGGGRGWEGGSL